MFDVALSTDDGRIRIIRSESGRVALALSLEEASQIRAGLKGALRAQAKKHTKHSKRRKNL